MTFDSDVKDPRYAGLYGPARSREKAEDQTEPPDQEFLDDWLARTVELVDKYQPQLVWFDWWIAQPAFHPNLQTFAAFYYNRGAEWGKGVAINYKKHGGESFPDTAGVLDIERGQLADLRPIFWQTDTSVSKTSWGYVGNHEYKTVDSIVDDLVDIVSKNGSLLLNIGPKPDGTIPEPEESDAPRDRRVARRERRGHLRDAPLRDLRRGAHRGDRGPLRRHQAEGLHPRGHPVHDARGDALRHRPGLARGPAGDRPLAGLRRGALRGRGRKRRASSAPRRR